MAVDVLGTRLVVFLSEDDRVRPSGPPRGRFLERAREDGMAGATVWRGVSKGFGSVGAAPHGPISGHAPPGCRWRSR